jgi:GLPGLI family protein
MSKKRLFTKLIITLIFIIQEIHIQAQIKEGHFQYAIMTTTVDTSLETRRKVGMMQNSKMDVFFTEVKSRIDFNIGTMYYSCIIVDNTIPRAISLNKSPQGSFAAYLGKDVLERNIQQDSTIHAELINETKTILGFECKKAIMYQNGDITIYWYTEQIKIDKRGNPLLNPYIPGFPMSFVKITDGMRIEYIVSNYETNLEQQDVLFSLMLPEGYKLMNNN